MEPSRRKNENTSLNRFPKDPTDVIPKDPAGKLKDNHDVFKMHLVVCEDNEAVIKIVSKQRSMAMRHVSRTHRVCLDWTYQVMQSPHIQLRYVNTREQIADMMTKALTKKDVWTMLISLSAIEPCIKGGHETKGVTDAPRPSVRISSCVKGGKPENEKQKREGGKKERGP